MGCGSSTKVSRPILIDECKATAKQDIKSPDSMDLNNISTPVPYTDSQIKKGVTRTEVVNNQTSNNILWEQDRNRLINLQNYIKTLQEKGVISK